MPSNALGARCSRFKHLHEEGVPQFSVFQICLAWAHTLKTPHSSGITLHKNISLEYPHTHTFCSQSVIFEIWHPDYVLITGFLFHKGCCLNGSPKKKIDSTKETQLNNKKKASKLSFLAGNLGHCVYLVAKQFILYTL